jgi:hypothetical protein
MNRNKLILAGLAAGAMMGLTTVHAAPAIVAQGGPTVYVQSAPPAPLIEPAPAPRAGFVWTPGHYEWRGDRYVWMNGRWIDERPGMQWQEAHWVQRTDGSWYLVGGQYVPVDRVARADRDPYGDIDGDGIINRDDSDRDGDGVSNRDDDRPNNPYRD